MKRGELIELNRQYLPLLGGLWVTARVDESHIDVVKVENYLPGCDFEYCDVTVFYKDEKYAPKFYTWIREWYAETEHRRRESERENRGMDEAKEGA
jgi:hypothetical protein